jgi:hypothetical protein
VLSLTVRQGKGGEEPTCKTGTADGQEHSVFFPRRSGLFTIKIPLPVTPGNQKY